MIFNPVVSGGNDSRQIATLTVLSGRRSYVTEFIDSDGVFHSREFGTFRVYIDSLIYAKPLISGFSPTPEGMDFVGTSIYDSMVSCYKVTSTEASI